jgi:hypothetical protein
MNKYGPVTEKQIDNFIAFMEAHLIHRKFPELKLLICGKFFILLSTLLNWNAAENCWRS